MSKLTPQARKKMPPQKFALPGRRYPVEDPAHARNALARAAQNATPSEQAQVRRKVHARFPGMGMRGLMRPAAK